MRHFPLPLRTLGESPEVKNPKAREEKMLNHLFDHALNLLRMHPNTKRLPNLEGWTLLVAMIPSSFLACATAAYAAPLAGASAASKQLSATFGKIPLSFQPNQGQADASVQFLSRGPGYSLFLVQGEVILNLEQQPVSSAIPLPGSKPMAGAVDTLSMKLLGANPDAAVAGVDPQSGVVSYLIGNDPKKWRSGIPTYGKVNYAQIYPGVDLVFYGNQRQLEYDFVVAPGADPSRIAWQIQGANAALDADGNLLLNAENGPASFKKPVVYQADGDKKIPIQGSYEVAGNQVRFRLGSYDHAKPLIIDPVLSYATYLGGTGIDGIGFFIGPGLANLPSQAIAVDAEGSVYVTGYTYSSDFPTQNSYKSTQPAKLSGSSWPSAFVTKFSPDGSSLVYSTYLGGSGYDYGYAIAVDSSGSAFVTGSTASPDFPVTAGAFQTVCSPQPNNSGGPPYSPACNSFNEPSAFVTKLNPTGTGLVYSTFLGGFGNAGAVAIALDAAGRAYVAGNMQEECDTNYLFESCFPTTAGAVISASALSTKAVGFLSVFDPSGAKLLYSTAFGDLISTGPNAAEAGDTYAVGVTVDANGYIYLVGHTEAGDLPTTTGVIQPTQGPAYNGFRLYAWRGFVAKFYPIASSGGTSLVYSTYLGAPALNSTSNLGDFIGGVAADSDGSVYVDGLTESPNYPVTTGAYQTTCYGAPGSSACSAAYVTKLNSTGSAIVWATYLGGFSISDALAMVGPMQLDGNGNVYIEGQMSGADYTFPLINPVEPYAGGNWETFVAELNPTGSKLLFSTAIGNGGTGGGTYAPAGLAVDAQGNIYSAGNTNDTGLLFTPGAFQTPTDFGTQCCVPENGVVAKISAQSTATVALAVSSSPAQAGQAVTLTATVTQAQQYASMPTGTVEFQDGSTTLNTATVNASGVAAYTTTSLTPGSHNLTAVYSGDTTYPTVNATQTLTVNGLTATVTVTPAATAISTAAALQVTVAVTGSGVAPTGTVTLLAGSYTPAAATLSSGSATFTIPANSLTVGTDTLTVSYSGDANYNSATGTTSVAVTAAPLTPTVTVTPAATTVDSGSSLSVVASVTGAGVTPSGTVTLSGGGYTASAGTLSSGTYTFSIPANSLSAGTDTLTVTYSGDTNYVAGTGTASVTVTPSAFTVAASTPAAVNPGSPATSTVTVSTATDYAGKVTLTCALTSSPSGATELPTCSAGTSTITLTSGTSTGTATVTVNSTAATTALMLQRGHKPSGWAASGGLVLAVFMLFGIPARRRSWQSMLGALVLMIALGALAGCGGGNSKHVSSGNAGTTAGNYTFTVTGTGSPSVTPAPATTFTLTIK
jgi:hypothetical protein